MSKMLRFTEVLARQGGKPAPDGAGAGGGAPAVLTLGFEERRRSRMRIKIDDGCYEIDGRDAEGRRIEVTVHPATLQVIEFEYENDDERPRRDREGGDDD